MRGTWAVVCVCVDALSLCSALFAPRDREAGVEEMDNSWSEGTQADLRPVSRSFRDDCTLMPLMVRDITKQWAVCSAQPGSTSIPTFS